MQHYRGSSLLALAEDPRFGPLRGPSGTPTETELRIPAAFVPAAAPAGEQPTPLLPAAGPS